MKRIFLISAFLILILSCEKADRICNCNNPIADLPWLRDLKASFTNCSCQISIFQATYNKQSVFYSLMNDPLCDGLQQIVLLDCSGSAVKTYALSDETFITEVTNRKVIYTCKTTK